MIIVRMSLFLSGVLSKLQEKDVCWVDWCVFDRWWNHSAKLSIWKWVGKFSWSVSGTDRSGVQKREKCGCCFFFVTKKQKICHKICRTAATPYCFIVITTLTDKHSKWPAPTYIIPAFPTISFLFLTCNTSQTTLFWSSPPRQHNNSKNN